MGHAADEPGGLLAHGGTIVGRGPPPPPPLRSPPRGRGFDRGPDRRGRYPGDGYRDHRTLRFFFFHFLPSLLISHSPESI